MALDGITGATTQENWSVENFYDQSQAVQQANQGVQQPSQGETAALIDRVTRGADDSPGPSGSSSDDQPPRKPLSCQKQAADIGAVMRQEADYKKALPYARAADSVNQTGDKPGSAAPAEPGLTRLPDTGVALSQVLGLPPGTIKDADLRDDQSGFRAALFRNQVDGKLILVARDTQPHSLADWTTNTGNGAERDTKQYQEMRSLADLLSRNGVSFNVAGYSKGGGLAQEAGLVNKNAQVYVFNSAGLSNASLARTGNTSFDSLAERTHAFSSEGDFLTYMNQTTDPQEQIANAQYLRDQLGSHAIFLGPISINYLNPETNKGLPNQRQMPSVTDHLSQYTLNAATQGYLHDLDQTIATAKEAAKEGKPIRLFPPVHASSQEVVPNSMTRLGRWLGATETGAHFGKLAQHQLENVVGPMEQVVKDDEARLRAYAIQCGGPSITGAGQRIADNGF